VKESSNVGSVVMIALLLIIIAIMICLIVNVHVVDTSGKSPQVTHQILKGGIKMDLKDKLINQYGADKLKVIEQNGKKYVDADFMNFVIGEMDKGQTWFMEQAKRLLFELGWKETEDNFKEKGYDIT